MTFTWFMTVAMVALVTAVSPGPVNLLAMSAGVHQKMRSGLLFVLGATFGFCALLFMNGIGLQSLISQVPIIMQVIKWAGIGFIAWIVWKLWQSDGKLEGDTAFQPNFVKGALLQWLNPKAWLVSVSVVGLYAPQDKTRLVTMTAIYFVICFLSICCWLWAGKLLTYWRQTEKYLQYFNKGLAVILGVSLLYLLF
ncbi:MAG: lysine transporter LysE [Proteobacteria bacterium]|nr:MAG: lysine transporter LysE [Pseudomonadota bacterium]